MHREVVLQLKTAFECAQLLSHGNGPVIGFGSHRQPLFQFKDFWIKGDLFLEHVINGPAQFVGQQRERSSFGMPFSMAVAKARA